MRESKRVRPGPWGTAPSGRHRRGTALLLAALAAVALAAAGSPARAEASAPAASLPGGYTTVARSEAGPGVTHWELASDVPRQRVHMARVDPAAASRIRVVLSNDRVGSSLERTSSMCLRVRCEVGVNGDFTDLTATGPVGAMVAGGELVRTPGIRTALLSLDGSGTPTIGHSEDLTWDTTVTFEGQDPLRVSGVNRARPVDGIMLYTPRFGPSTRTGDGGRELVLELAGGAWGELPEGGTGVRMVGLRAAGNTPIGPGRVVLSGQGNGAADLERLWLESTSGTPGLLRVSTGGARETIGGSPVLLREGRWAFPNNDDNFTRGRHPRTLAGWTAGGEFLLVTVDGRQSGYSAGMSLGEAAELLAGMGAIEAINLDGGGSTTFVTDGFVRNRPSGGERQVTSALVVVPPPGSVATAQIRGTDLACPSGGTSAGFTDVRADSPHRTPIDCIVALGLANGTSPGRYSPGRAVTRAEMASFIARLVERSGGSLPVDAPDRFPDDDASVHHDNINRLAAAGLLSGRADGTLGPDELMTRAQMATFLTRVHEYRTGEPLSPTADYFADDRGNTHEPAINRAAFAGFTGGSSHPHLYQPSRSVGRDQMASFLARTYDRLIEDGHAPPQS